MASYYVDPVNGNDANDGGGWWKLALASGVGAQPVAGETATGAGGATGQVIKITGTWATSPTVYLYNRNGTAFANGEAITFSGGGSCVNAQGTPYNAVVASFKTIKKTFAAGDTINVAKSAETAAAGTVTGTTGSVSVPTTNDLTAVCPQYTVIRIGGDNTLYMVKAISSSVITLYRPYRGATAAGKGLTYFTGLPTSVTNDWNPTSMPGTFASPITLQAGMSTVNNTQDGFTVLYGNNSNVLFGGTYTFTNMSRVATLYWSYPWTVTFVDCSLTNCFSFRNTAQFGTNVWTRVVVSGFVTEIGLWCYGVNMVGGTINNLETAEPSGPGFQTTVIFYNTLVTSWKNAGYASYPALHFTANIFESRFVDPVFDELASGCLNLRLAASPLYAKNVIFQNPTFGAGTVFTIQAGYAFMGEVRMSNVNGSLTDHRSYLGISNTTETGKYTLLSYDASTYHTAAPAAKVSLFQSAYPTIVLHHIPCDAGVQKTISVWFRKNSSYGSITLPIMRLRWMTGNAGALVSNVHDVTMVDTNDTWLQYSYAITPTIDADVIVELIFQSANSGAIAWYDDLVKS
jgi:hypothetical protein